MADPAPTASYASSGPPIPTSPPYGDDGGVADHIESAAPPVSAPGLCPYYHEAVELIGKRWTGAIVHTLLTGPLRFSELAHAIPQISDRLLSMRLKELEASGLVARRVWDEAPVRVEYELTAKGRALQPVLTSLRRWACEWLRD